MAKIRPGKLSFRLEEESEDGSNACKYSGSVESVGCTSVWNWRAWIWLDWDTRSCWHVGLWWRSASWVDLSKS